MCNRAHVHGKRTNTHGGHRRSHAAQATAAQQAQTKTAISDTDKAEGTTSSNTTDSSDSAVDVKRDNNAAPVSATSVTDSTIPH